MINFIPTPIGNLKDISFRAVETLQNTTFLLCEDTRVTKRLIFLLEEKLDIKFPIFQYKSIHSHNEQYFLQDENEVIELLSENNCAYLSDAGMPCVSDPGSFLVDFCIRHNLEYDVLPGANAVLTSYAMSGFGGTEFSFFGFLPHKGKDRLNKLNDVLFCANIAILYESPHRLLKLFKEICEINEDKNIYLVKEISKKFQKYYKNSAKNIYKILKDEDIRGEWAVVIEQNEQNGQNLTVEDIQSVDIPPKQKSKLLAKLTGKTTKEIYQNQI